LLDIESALQKIDDVTSNQEGTAAEEALILRGCVTMHFGVWTAPLTTHSRFCLFQSPQPKQLGVYIDALERLNASIAFASTAANQRDTVRHESSHSPSLFPYPTVGRRGWSKRGPRSSRSCSRRLLPLAPQALLLRVLSSRSPCSLGKNSQLSTLSSSFSADSRCRQRIRLTQLLLLFYLL
jgi:hypothetical protein